MRTIVFLGPTLPVEVAKAIVDAEFLPPVQQGDVLRALKHQPDAIGIIDGYFQSVPSVWHKEILTALAEGVDVIGASSMGALRAAELEHFGMIGIGTVFERFRSGEYTDDDEVAVVHAPAEQGFHALSEAMVNVRDLCAAALSYGVITVNEHDELVIIAKQLHFSQRRWDTILAMAAENGLPRDVAIRIKAFRAKHPQGVKERDAIAMLQHLSANSTGRVESRGSSLRVEQTAFFVDLKHEVKRESLREPEEAPPTQLNAARKKVLLGILASREVVRRGLVIRADDVAGMQEWFRSTYALESDDQFAGWQAKHGLKAAEYDYAMQRFTEVIRLEEACRPEVDAELDNYLKVYSAAAQHQSDAPQWIQLNVALARGRMSPQQSAGVLFRHVLSAVQTLQKSGAVERFHFVRKSPDVRLRFRAVEPECELLPYIHKLLRRLHRDGIIASAQRSVYEPEARMFGGVEAMEAAHTFFEEDSIHWIRWGRIASRDRTLSVEQFCTAVVNDLFMRVLGCPEEVWDTWHNLGELTQGCRMMERARVTGGETITEALGVVCRAERTLLKACVRANQVLAASIQAVWANGRLGIGLRSLLPMLAMFHFNRFGLDGGNQASIAGRAAQAWDPYREIRQRSQERIAVGQVRSGSRASQP